MYSKGQIISKGLLVSSNSPKKRTNERIHCSSINEFVPSFFGRIRGYQKSFRNYLTFSWCPTCSDEAKQLVNDNIIFKMCHFGTVCSGNWQYETMMGVLIVRHESSLQEGIFGSKWDDRFLPPSFFPSPKPQFKDYFGVKLFLKLLEKNVQFLCKHIFM